MVDRIRKFQILNMQIFSVLEKYMSRSDQLTQNVDRPIIHLAPPVPENMESIVDDGQQFIVILGSDEENSIV